VYQVNNMLLLLILLLLLLLSLLLHQIQDVFSNFDRTVVVISCTSRAEFVSHFNLLPLQHLM